MDKNPRFLQFSKYGKGEKEILLENEVGQPQLVKAESLANLSKFFTNHLECVILNACYSEIQAEVINEHINYVIDMIQAIGDKAAIKFTVGFYDAIGAGKTDEEAFEFSQNTIELAS